MKLLAVDTSTDACSVALMLDDDSIDELHEICPRQHTQRLLPMVDTLLARAGIRAADLDGFVLGAGPGSFTGVRLGSAAVQGLAWSLERPLVCISSLATCAYGVCREAYARGAAVALITVAMDARMGEVYLGVYEPRSICIDDDAEAVHSSAQHAMQAAAGCYTPVQPFELRRLLDEQVCPPHAIAAIDQLRPQRALPGLNEQALGAATSGIWVAAGSGWAIHPSALTTAFGGSPDHLVVGALPRARDLVVLGRDAWLAGQACDALDAKPVYLRNNVATPRAAS